MEECLAIKPDLIFLWDEAWFAFARFGPTYRQRTAMNAANNLRERLQRPNRRRLGKAAGEAEGRGRRDAAENPAGGAARCAGAGLCHAVDAQDADGAAAGFDDPRQRPGLQGRGRAELSRSLHDPHLDLAQLPDHRLARCRPAAGGAGGVRVRAAPGRGGDGDAARDLDPSAAAEVLQGADRRRHDPGRVPGKRGRELLLRRPGLDRHLGVLGEGRVRAGRHPRHPGRWAEPAGTATRSRPAS
jgi:hypothetical protein